MSATDSPLAVVLVDPLDRNICVEVESIPQRLSSPKQLAILVEEYNRIEDTDYVLEVVTACSPQVKVLQPSKKS